MLNAETCRLIDSVEDPKMRRQLEEIYRDHPDGKGRRGEVTTPPTPGSHKYPWRRRAKVLPSDQFPDKD